MSRKGSLSSLREGVDNSDENIDDIKDELDKEVDYMVLNLD